ncbi:hypothetical protein [Flavobacterium microcysteis]
MTDNQLYDFFKTRSNSFDEMPSDIVWNKINKELRPENTPISNSTILKGIVLLVLATALVSFLIYLFSDKSEQVPSSPVKKETITKHKEIIKTDSNSNIQEKFEKATSDTTKRKRIPFKRIGLLPAKQIVPISSNTIGILPDSIKTIKPKANDTLKYKPQILGNRYLYESKEELTKEGFDLFIQEVLKENELQYGRLIVIKSKGHIPFRKLIKKAPNEIRLTDDQVKLNPKPVFVRGRIIMDTISNSKRDSVK